MKKKILGAILALSMVLSLSSCGKDEAQEANATVTTTEKVITLADKKAFVEENYPHLIHNDFRAILPYSDIFEISLADLKTAVNSDEVWNEDNSTFAEFSTVSGFSANNIVYTFSNRGVNLEGGDSIGSHFFAGLGNLGSVVLETAQYNYVSTDNTSKQTIEKVYVCVTNYEYTSSEYADKLLQIFMNGKKVEDNGPAYIEFKGLISDIDYEAIYDYANGLTDEFPACIGTLRYYYKDDNTIVIQILS